MRCPTYDDPREPWADDYYSPRPAAPAWPDAHVNEDNDERIPFGFQLPTRVSRTRRLPLSRQARAMERRRP